MTKEAVFYTASPAGNVVQGLRLGLQTDDRDWQQSCFTMIIRIT